MAEVFHERLKAPIPTSELQRRWKRLQEAMKKNGIDCILTQNSTQYMGGYNRWLTDTTAENAYPQSVIIPCEGEMYLIAYGGPPLETYPPKYAVRGGKACKNVPYFSPFNFTHTWEGKIAVEWAKSNDIKVMGIAGFELIHSAYYEYMLENLPNVEIIDATDLVDEIKCVKSEEEIKYIKKSAYIQDKVFGYLPALVYPGKREFEIRSKLMHLLTDLGSEEQIVIIGSAPKGETLTPYPSHLQNRTLEDGDQVYVCLSSSGPGGFFTAIGRMVSIGAPTQALKDDWSLALEAQRKITDQNKVGSNPQVIFTSYNEFLRENNCMTEAGLFAYGQGYDFIERPSIQPGETMLIKNDMCLAVNTNIVSANRTVYCCDSYLTTPSGPVRLHTTPQEIIIT